MLSVSAMHMISVSLTAEARGVSVIVRLSCDADPEELCAPHLPHTHQQCCLDASPRRTDRDPEWVFESARAPARAASRRSDRAQAPPDTAGPLENHMRFPALEACKRAARRLCLRAAIPPARAVRAHHAQAFADRSRFRTERTGRAPRACD